MLQKSENIELPLQSHIQLVEWWTYWKGENEFPSQFILKALCFVTASGCLEHLVHVFCLHGHAQFIENVAAEYSGLNVIHKPDTILEFFIKFEIHTLYNQYLLVYKVVIPHRVLANCLLMFLQLLFFFIIYTAPYYMPRSYNLPDSAVGKVICSFGLK